MNMKKNKVHNKITPENADGMLYIPKMVYGDVCLPDHLVMNLPESAPEFLATLTNAFNKVKYCQFGR